MMQHSTKRWPPFGLSVTIITLNEEANLPRAIQSVKWADEVLVIDSGSTDKTTQIAKEMGAKLIQNTWPGYGKQKNFAQNNATYDWVLNIDADEEVTENLKHEITQVLEEVYSGRMDAQAFYIPRKTFYLGRWIKHGGWYPNYLIRLADRRKCHWTEPNVHEELLVNGKAHFFKNPLNHYTFTDIEDQIRANLRFSRLGSLELQKRGQRASLLWLLIKPIGKFIETYFIKCGILDGLPGLIISINAAYSMFLKYAYLFEAKLKNANSDYR